MAGVRNAFIGRLGLPTVFDPISELLGSEIVATGDSTAVGARRVKGFTLSFPIHGTQGDADTFGTGARMRRQLRSFMQNAPYRLGGVYVQLTFDPERDGWLVIGTASLADVNGGPTFSEYSLTIDSAFRIAALNSHRDGYRIDLTDLRLPASPIDYYGQFIGGSFPALTPLSLLALPVGATDPAVLDAACVAITRPSIDGNVPLIITKEPSWTGLSAGPLTNGDVVTWERTEASMNKGDVVVYDRRGFLGPFGVSGAYDPVAYPADIQATYGWEEIYGSDYPYSWTLAGGVADVPVIHNGLCRVRYDTSNTPGFKVDSWNGTTYVEQGKILIQGASSNYDNVWISASVVEYTPDRAVIQAIVQANTAPLLSRERVLITLQRGWSGPRVEVYAPAAAPSIIYATPTPADANDAVMKIDAAGVYLSSAVGSGTSPFTVGGTTIGAATFTGENEVVLVRQGALSQVNFAVVQAAVLATALSGTGAYSATTPAVKLTGPVGYVSVKIGYPPAVAAQTFEAEAIRFVSANTSQVADAVASGGQAVQSTAVASAQVLSTATVLRQAVYRCFVRAKAATAGGTASLTWQLGATTSPTFTTTANAFVWVDLGEISAPAASSTFQLNAWRSAGTGNVIIDRVELVLMQDRTAASPNYLGARDSAQHVLYDQRVAARRVPRA